MTAFQAQNQFLNKEIIELNEIKKKSEIKMHRLEGTIIELEAKKACIQSKLLSLLKELNLQEEDEEDKEDNLNKDENKKLEKSKSIAQNESIKELVKRLLDDENSLDIPYSWRNPKNNFRDKKKSLKQLTNSSTTTIVEYDELGFQNKITHENNEFDDLFGNFNDFKKENSLDEQERLEWRKKWDDYISSISNNEQLQRTNELKLLLRSGVPQEYRYLCYTSLKKKQIITNFNFLIFFKFFRPKIWRLCINMLIDHKKPHSDPNYYQNLVKESQRRNWNTSIKQIELDLLRTLPNNRNFESKQCDGIIRLRRVLTG